jgi:hypothetical protein
MPFHGVANLPENAGGGEKEERLANPFDHDITRRIELFRPGVRGGSEDNGAICGQAAPKLVEVDLNTAGLG